MLIKQRRAFLLRFGITAFAVMLVAAVYFMAAAKARDDLQQAADRQLELISRDVQALLEKFETLPFSVAFEPDVAEAIRRPDDAALIARLNLTLQRIQTQARISAIYVMNGQGDTLASSNWDQAISYVGRNFAFRPYFADAMAGKAGRFYGVGSATGEPGYFIAQPVYADPRQPAQATPIGVVAVKIALGDFEHTWASSEDPIALVDHDGVVFLSNREHWKYRSIRPLDATEQRHLDATLQYAGQAIDPIAALPARARYGFGRFVERPIAGPGWRLLLFPQEGRVIRAGVSAALATVLLLLIAGISSLALHQRRRRLEIQRESRAALKAAADELERKIAQRTQELVLANRDVKERYAKLKETERLLRTTQDELVQAGKLAMLGQMAAGITHELNQPLAAIRAFADNAVTFLQRGRQDKAAENLGHIADASARMGAIIGQLKGFARKTGQALAPVDLAGAIHASARLLHGEFARQDVELELHAEPGVAVLGDTVRMEQVLINLMRNALDAVEGRPERRVSVLLERDGEHARIRIRDSGPGIPEEVARHLFEPFFTTKGEGQGLGLGLAISSSIVQAMNGRLDAGNHAQGGAEFIVRLPLQQDAANQEGEAIGTSDER